MINRCTLRRIAFLVSFAVTAVNLTVNAAEPASRNLNYTMAVPLPSVLSEPAKTPSVVADSDGIIRIPVQVSPNANQTIQTAAPQFSSPNVTPLVRQPETVKGLPVAAENAALVTKAHQLTKLTATAFEKKLLDKLGSRFVAVRGQENADNQAAYQLPLQGSAPLNLTIDNQNGIVTVTGTAEKTDAVVQIIRLLDTVDDAEFAQVQRPNLVAVKHVAQVVNQETQRGGGQAAAKALPPPTDNSGSVLGPVQIDVIDGLDTMVIKGSPKDVQAIQNMIQQLETMSLEHEPVIELVPMQHADSYRVGRLVQQLYSQVYLARRGNVTILPLIKPNTILMIGKEESIKAAKELVVKLDTPVAADASFQIFRLQHAAAETLATQITQSFTQRPGYNNGLETQLSIVADFRTNALIVQANPRDLVEVAAMIKQLDTAGSDITNLVKTFSLKNAMASELATTLQNAFSATSTTTGFGNTASNSAANQRGTMVSFGQVDKDGNMLRSSILYDVKIAADTRSNTLIVQAPQDTLPLIEALIAQLDQLPSAESQIKVFTLVNGDAYTLTTMLQNLFASGTTSGGGFGGGTASQSNQMAVLRPGIEENDSTLVSVRFQTDIRTNSIIACGTAGEMVAVEALLLRLDAENTNNRSVIMLKLVNTPAEQIAPILQQYVANERQLDIQNSTTYLPQSPLEQYQKELNVVAEPIGNYLIISTTPRYAKQIRKIVQELDERPLMAAIQVLIAEVRLNNSKDLGVELGLQDSILFDRSIGDPTGGLVPGFLFGDPSKGLPLASVRSGNVGTQGITSLGTNRSPSSGIGGFTFSASSESVSILVRALETKSQLRVLSNPQLVTMHNKRASVLVGQRVPFVSGVNTTNGTSQSETDWNDVGTVLDITPRIMPDGMIAMAVYVEKSSLGSEADGVPMYSSGQGTGTTVIRQAKINKTTAQTTINAMDGQTVVFAGLITEQKEHVNHSVPFLNKIPVVRKFFEYDSTISERNELLIVITPTIIRNREDIEMLKQQETSRIHWCINDVVRLTGNTAMRLRSDEWQPGEILLHKAEPVILDDRQLPPDSKIPVPTLAPVVKE